MAAGPINLFEFEDLARDRMGLEQYDHIAGGATDEISIRRARGIFDSMMLRPRVLVDITKRDLSTTALDHRIGLPVMLAPAGMHGRAHPQAELASVRAAGALGTVMVVSAGANFKLEEVAKAATSPIWFQQSLYRDREFTRSMAERAHAAGYTAICITVDSTLPAKDERGIRHKYRNRPSPNYAGAEPETKALGVRSGPGGSPELRDIGATWDCLDWLASSIPLPIVVKGIMTPRDARLSVQHGARALIVSNHGGRQLDTNFVPVEVLPQIVDAVDGQVEVYLDGRHPPGHRCAQGPGVRRQGNPYWPPGVLGAGCGRRGRCPPGITDSNG